MAKSSIEYKIRLRPWFKRAPLIVKWVAVHTLPLEWCITLELDK